MKPAFSNICKVLTDICTNHVANFVLEWLSVCLQLVHTAEGPPPNISRCMHNIAIASAVYMSVLSGQSSRQKLFHLIYVTYSDNVHSMMSYNSHYKLTFRYVCAVKHSPFNCIIYFIIISNTYI